MTTFGCSAFLEDESQLAHKATWPSSQAIFSCVPCRILCLARAELWQSAVFEKTVCFSFFLSLSICHTLFIDFSFTFPHANSYSYYKLSSSNLDAFSYTTLPSLHSQILTAPSLSWFFLSQPVEHGKLEIIHISTNIY